MKYQPQFLIDNSVESNKLIISKVNEVHMRIESEAVIRQELHDFFHSLFLVLNLCQRLRIGCGTAK
jgi:hypothetical protein